jgi:hypothetical protein
MKNIYLLFVIILVSCIENSNYSVPEIICSETDLIETHTIQQVKEMAGFGLNVINEDIVISGYVVTTDAYGNFYKSLYLQDKSENATTSIEVQIDLPNYYTKFPLGRKIFIRLQGLSIVKAYGVVTIGKAIGGDLERIPNVIIKDHIFRSCEVEEVHSKKINIQEINDSNVGLFVKFENIQLKNSSLEKTYANTSDTKSVDIEFEQFSENCKSNGVVTVQTSGFSKFKSAIIPNKNGVLEGVIDKYYGLYHLKINDTANVQFHSDRCESSEKIKATISIEEMRALYKGAIVEFGVDENLVIQGYVISSDEEKNIQNKIVLQDAPQDAKAGIQILVDKENYFESIVFGEKVYVNLNKLYLDEVDGELFLGIYKDGSVGEIEDESLENYLTQTDSLFAIVPKEESIENLSTTAITSVFTKINDVQLVASELGKAFAYYSGNESAKRWVETCGEIHKVAVLTNGEAVFANNRFPSGKGSVSGIFSNRNSTVEIQMNYQSDILFLEEYEDCPKIIPQILITEIADPENSVSSRFVELYNAGNSPVNISGWKLNKYINGSETVSSNGLELSGIIKSKEFFLVANTGFREVFGFEPNIESNSISGNGDDVYELVNEYGNRQDIFGVVGEDGTGTSWEYTDGKAERKLIINVSNAFFDAEEWVISSKEIGGQKMAPQDYSPLQR